jgi:hypothetical protein
MTLKQIAKALGFKTGYTIENNAITVIIDTVYGQQKHVIGYSAKYDGLFYKINDWHYSANGSYIMTAAVVKNALYKPVIDKTK